jgi:hypothetical protein
MKAHRLKTYLPLLLVTLSTMAAAQTPRLARVADMKLGAQQEIVKRARQSYYSLRAAGLEEFKSTIKPNWEMVLHDQIQADPKQAQAALVLLNGLHFTMLLDKDGKVTVSHSADTEPPNEKVRKGFEQIYGGIDQAVSGFFATWSIFMLTSPFPEIDSVYQLDDLGSQYRLSYKEGVSDIVTLLGKDLVISEIKVTTPQFVSTVRPLIRKSDKGYVLAGYVGDYTPTSGGGVVHLDVKIQHGPVNGLQLPVTLLADSVYDGTPTRMELAFSEYQVKTH